jgi:pimeloyl-ACP methyl ester carboxylesterase
MKALQAERKIASHHGEITYYTFGNGPALLFLNGLGASWHGFRRQIAHLSNRYRCIAFDYRGVYRDHETSARHVPTIPDHARDALAIIEQEGLTRVALIGWSLGVQVALQVFADAPSRVALLLLVSGGARAPWGTAPEAGPFRRFFPSAIELLGRAPTLVSALVQTGGSSPETLAWGRRLGLVGPGVDAEHFAEVSRNWSRLEIAAAVETLREMMRLDLSAVLAAIDVPTLVIGGDRDPFTSRAALERLVHRIAGAEYLLLPGASHYLLLDHAQHVNLRIDKFFAERGFNGQSIVPGTSPPLL